MTDVSDRRSVSIDDDLKQNHKPIKGNKPTVVVATIVTTIFLMMMFMEIDVQKFFLDLRNVSAPHGGHPDRMHGMDDRKDGIVPKNINDLVAKGSDLQRHRMVRSPKSSAKEHQ